MTENKVIQWLGELYCYHDSTLYTYTKETGDWTKIAIDLLPEHITVTSYGGLAIKQTLASDKYVQAEYIGDLIKEDVCNCPIKDLMAEGCKCGGE